MAGDFGDLIDQSANLRTLAPAAVASQVGIMAVISVSSAFRSVDGGVDGRANLCLS